MGKIVGLTFEDPAVKMYGCPFCDKEYKTQKALDDHIKKVHPEKAAELPKE